MSTPAKVVVTSNGMFPAPQENTADYLSPQGKRGGSQHTMVTAIDIKGGSPPVQGHQVTRCLPTCHNAPICTVNTLNRSAYVVDEEPGVQGWVNQDRNWRLLTRKLQTMVKQNQVFYDKSNTQGGINRLNQWISSTFGNRNTPSENDKSPDPQASANKKDSAPAENFPAAREKNPKPEGLSPPPADLNESPEGKFTAERSPKTQGKDGHKSQRRPDPPPLLLGTILTWSQR